MWPALDPAGHRVPRTKPTCLLYTWRPHRRRPLALVLHLHKHQSSRNLHLQYLAKNQSIQSCQSLITQGSDHPPVLEPHMVLFSSIPLDLASFGGHKLGYGLPMRCSYCPQRFGFGGVDPWVLFIPRSPGHTGLTGASHCSNRCNPCWVFARVNVWVCLLLSHVVAVLWLGHFGAR
jgi:hypothetical protein